MVAPFAKLFKLIYLPHNLRNIHKHLNWSLVKDDDFKIKKIIKNRIKTKAKCKLDVEKYVEDIPNKSLHVKFPTS